MKSFLTIIIPTKNPILFSIIIAPLILMLLIFQVKLFLLEKNITKKNK
jgi:hypothetical protein